MDAYALAGSLMRISLIRSNLTLLAHVLGYTKLPDVDRTGFYKDPDMPALYKNSDFKLVFRPMAIKKPSVADQNFATNYLVRRIWQESSETFQRNHPANEDPLFSHIDAMAFAKFLTEDIAAGSTIIFEGLPEEISMRIARRQADFYQTGSLTDY